MLRVRLLRVSFGKRIDVGKLRLRLRLGNRERNPVFLETKVITAFDDAKKEDLDREQEEEANIFNE